MKKILLIGYGNPGRLDDGLGPGLAAAVESEGLPGLTVESDYQLSVEDSHLVAKHDVVIFADADVACEEPFYFRRMICGESQLSFSSHDVSPGEVMSLARSLFGADTEAYILGIRGYEFNSFGERLSDKASANLDKAVAFVKDLANNGVFPEDTECVVLHNEHGKMN